MLSLYRGGKKKRLTYINTWTSTIQILINKENYQYKENEKTLIEKDICTLCSLQHIHSGRDVKAA